MGDPPIHVEWDKDDFTKLLTEAEARGFRRAVEALRDDDGFMDWLAANFPPDPGVRANQQIADSLSSAEGGQTDG